MRGGRAGRSRCYGCVLWPVRLVCRALSEGVLYTLTQCTAQASQVVVCSQNTDNVLCGLYVSTFNQVCGFWLSVDCGSLKMVSLWAEACWSSFADFGMFW